MAKPDANTKKATPVAPASPEEPATNPAADEAVTAQDNPACQNTAPDADQAETNCEGGATAEDTLSSLEAEADKFIPGTYYQDCVDGDKVTVMASVINGVLAGRGSARDDLNNEHYRQRLVDNAELVADEVIRRCTYSRKVEPICSEISSDINS